MEVGLFFLLSFGNLGINTTAIWYPAVVAVFSSLFLWVDDNGPFGIRFLAHIR